MLYEIARIEEKDSNELVGFSVIDTCTEKFADYKYKDIREHIIKNIKNNIRYV